MHRGACRRPFAFIAPQDYMNSYYVAILQGSVLTIGVSLCALLVSIVLGLLGAAAKLSGRPVLVGISSVYTTVIRGVPDLVVMLLVFYGGTIGLNHLLEWVGSKKPSTSTLFLPAY